MRIRSIGNDIVDLKHDVAPHHPRFLTRVFTDCEQKVISREPTLQWSLWAAKEASFKALKRLDSRLVFAPSAFEVDLQAMTVCHNSRRLVFGIKSNSEYVLALCATSAQLLDELSYNSWVTEVYVGSNPSIAVRDFATRKIAECLLVPQGNLEVAMGRGNRIPQILNNGVATRDLISLSHHGRFAAACFARSTSNNLELKTID